MKIPRISLCIASLAALAVTGCYTQEEVHEPAGTVTRTTVSKTVSVNEPAGAAPVVPAPPALPVVERRVVTTTPVVQETIIVEAPPAPQVEPAGTPPTGGHAWVPGHWSRAGDRWVWLSGRWEVRPGPTSVYIPGHWDAQGSGYVWREGYWK